MYKDTKGWVQVSFFFSFPQVSCQKLCKLKDNIAHLYKMKKEKKKITYKDIMNENIFQNNESQPVRLLRYAKA